MKPSKQIICGALFVATFNVFSQGGDLENHYKGLNKNHFDSTSKWSYHFQMTSIFQGHPSFHAAYSGNNSLRDSSETALSLTTTLFLGRKLWKGAGLFFNPEIAGGKGMSYALGLAGAANGETFRIGSPSPQFYVARFFFQQHFNLKSPKKDYQEEDVNQLRDSLSPSRITISAGKFSVADFFDDNAYSHDPRSEFMNWALMSNGAWDYPANTRGYTWGFVIELIKPGYAIRASSVLVPLIANSEIFDLNITKSHSEIIEFEKKLKIGGHPGSIRLLAYSNLSTAPAYADAVGRMAKGDSSLIPVLSGKQQGPHPGGWKYGFGLNFWQEITTNMGVFGRLGWNDGHTATWAFTEIDHTASLGISLKGGKLRRPDDVFGIACVVNDISQDHYNYLSAGGYGFMLGDGKLTHYGNENILETFYKFRFLKSLWITLDYQFILNPGYNADRGPVNVYSARVHVEI